VTDLERQQTPLFYCGDEVHQAKLEKVQAALRDRGLDGLLLLKHDSVRYVTEFYAKGYRPFLDFEYAAYVPAGQDPVLAFSLAGEERRAAIRSRASDLRRLPRFTEWAGALAGIIRDYGATSGRVGFDLLPHFIYAGIRTELPHLDLIDANDVWIDLAAVKHPLEVELIRESLRIAEAGMTAALGALAPGKTEIEISAEAEYRMRRLGSEMNPFIPVVASGTNAAVWERIATDRRIGTGEMVILDFGCVHKGCTGDVARTTVVGEPTLEQRAIYRAGYEALQEAMRAVRPGVLCSEIDRIARDVIREAGYERYQAPWAVGHQLGYGLHGEPLLGPGVDVPLRAGMVINIEPALYTFDELEIGGVEIEDSLLVTETGAERLTTLPYDEALLA
jgi:Xaa-Pro aminopeptidase